MDSPEFPSPADSFETPDTGPVIARSEIMPQGVADGALGRVHSLARKQGLVPAEGGFTWKGWLAGKLQPGKGGKLVRFLLLYGGVIAPLVFLGSGAALISMMTFGPPGPTRLYHLAGEFFLGWALVPFVPLLLYAATACVLALWEIDRFGPKLWVRWGLYAGVALAVQYFFLHGVVLTQARSMASFSVLVEIPLLLVLSVGVPVGLFVAGWAAWRVVLRSSGRDTAVVAAILSVMIGLVVCVLSIAAMSVVMLWAGLLLLAPLLPVAVLLGGIPVAAPAWAVGTYLLLSVFTALRYGQGQFRLWQVFAAFVLFAVYFTAWRYALNVLM